MTADRKHGAESEGSRLSVVIPAFNEEARIGSTLDQILAYLDHRETDFEVIVVDDGSSDATSDMVESFPDPPVRLHRLASNQGKGAALRAGVAASSGDWVLLCDADLSTPIEDVEALEKRTAEADMVLGSRAVSGARVLEHQPVYRELMGKTFNRILRLLGLVQEQDTQCGFKLIRGDLARNIFDELTIDHFAFDVELVCLAKDRGVSVVEQGVRWVDSPDSRVRPMQDSWRMLIDVLKLRWRRWF